MDETPAPRVPGGSLTPGVLGAAAAFALPCIKSKQQHRGGGTACTAPLPLETASSLEKFSFSKHFIMISRLFSKPLMPFLSWMVRRAAQAPHPAGLPASRTGVSFPRDKPEPEKPRCDAADTDAPSWQIFQLCGTSSTEQPRAECEGHLVGAAAKYRCLLQHRLPNTPQEPNPEGFSHQESSLLGAPDESHSLPRQGGACGWHQGSQGRGWRHRLAAASQVLIIPRG